MRGRTLYKRYTWVRERDSWCCQVCGAERNEHDYDELDVHHIDGDHGNDCPTNVVTLCHSCHSTVTNARDSAAEFERLLTAIVTARYELVYVERRARRIQKSRSLKQKRSQDSKACRLAKKREY